MKTKLALKFAATVLWFATLGLPPSTAFAQGTAFNYDGKLNDGGIPANGSYDLSFTLYNASTNGTPFGALTNTGTMVSNGLFTLTLDFGGVFNGSNFWLEIAARSNGSGAFTSLSPRQPILPAPYAIYASNAGSAVTATTAGTANSVSATNITGTLPLAQLPAAVITNDSANLTIGGTNLVAPLTVPPTVPVSAIGSVATGNGPFNFAVAGRYAYVGNYYDNKLQVFDVSSPSAPVLVGSAGTGNGPYSVVVAGRYAYVSNQGDNTLQIFDVGNPSSPVSVGSVGAGNSVAAVAVAGRYAYVVNDGAGTLEIIDVSNPLSPVNVGSVGGVSGPALAVAGRYAYVGNDGAGKLQIFDVSNPSSPVSVGSVATISGPVSIAVVGRYAYMAMRTAGTVQSSVGTLQILDVSNPTNPVSAGSVGTGNGASYVAVAGRYAYVTLGGVHTWQIFDVSNPSAPVNVGSVGADDFTGCVVVAGRYAYVNNPNINKLQIFDMGGAYLQQLEAGALETGTLQTRDTVTVGNNLNVRGGFTASGSARISGGLSVDNGTITATNFSGNGGGLTNLNASALSGSIPSSALTSLPATNLTGTIPAALLPAAVVTNTETGVALGGTFNGDGSGLASLNGSQIASGTVEDARLSTNVPLLSAANTFSANQTVNGVVGIGVPASPATALHIVSPNANAKVLFESSVANGNPSLTVKANSPAGEADIVADRADTGASATHQFATGGVLDWRLGTPNFTSGEPSRLDLSNTNGTAVMTFRQNGNVGIGTTQPTGVLQVVGATAQGITMTAGDNVPTADGANINLTAGSATNASGGTGSGGAIVLTGGTGSLCGAGGNGCTSAGGAGAAVTVGGGGSGNGGDGGNLTLDAGNGGFNQGGGGVSISGGTGGEDGGSPAAITVNGGAPNFGAGGNIILQAGLGAQGVSNTGDIAMQIAGTEYMRIANNGNVGIGTTTPAYTLQVNGSVAGVGAYQNVSDARYKTNITRLTHALDKIMALRGVKYEWRRDAFPQVKFDNGAQLGFVAQEIREVLPEVVSQDAQGYYSIAYSKVIPVLAEAIKDQQKEMEQEMQGKNAVIRMLKQQNDSLAQRLNELETTVKGLAEKKAGL